MKRRRFISAGLAAAGGTLSCRTQPPDPAAARATITGLEVFRIHVQRTSQRSSSWVIPRIQSSAGVTGIGDASHAGSDDPQIPKLHEYFELIKGRGVYDIEWLRQRVQPQIPEHGRAAVCALSGIEQALFDIQGKLAGVPAYQLFGGQLRMKIRNYANINRSTEPRTPEGFAEMAGRAIEAGFSAVKLASFDGMPREGSEAEKEAHTRQGIECIRAVREKIGPDNDLLIDAHSNFDLTRGLDLLKRLEPFNLFWLEEVSRPLENLAAINKAAKMPTAGGESLYGVEENIGYMAAGAVDILMPDVKYCGGMLELKKISAMAEGFGLPSAPHGPASPVGNVAAAHVCAGLPNFQILEFAFGEVPWRPEIIDPPEQIENGFLTLSDRPGLGIAVNEATAKKYALS